METTAFLSWVRRSPKCIITSVWFYSRVVYTVNKSRFYLPCHCHYFQAVSLPPSIYFPQLMLLKHKQMVTKISLAFLVCGAGIVHLSAIILPTWHHVTRHCFVVNQFECITFGPSRTRLVWVFNEVPWAQQWFTKIN